MPWIRGHRDCAPDPWHRTLWPDLAQALDLPRNPYPACRGTGHTAARQDKRQGQNGRATRPGKAAGQNRTGRTSGPGRQWSWDLLILVRKALYAARASSSSTESPARARETADRDGGTAGRDWVAGTRSAGSF